MRKTIYILLALSSCAALSIFFVLNAKSDVNVCDNLSSDLLVGECPNEPQESGQEEYEPVIIEQPQIIAKTSQEDRTVSRPQISTSEHSSDNIPKVVYYRPGHTEAIVGKYDGRMFDDPTDNIFEFILDFTPGVGDRLWFEYELTGLSHHTEVATSINDRHSTGGMLLRPTEVTTRQSYEINPLWFNSGHNRVQFSVPQNFEGGYRIADFRLKVERGDQPERLLVDFNPDSYGQQVYIHGVFVSDGNQTEIVVNGNTTDLVNGAFEAKFDYADQIVIQAGDLTHNIVLTSCTDNYFTASQPDVLKSITYAEQWDKGRISIGNAALVFDSLTLKHNIPIIASTLRHSDIPALGGFITNATDSFHGYRFLPHGEHFINPAVIAMKYDPSKIPSGFRESDLRTFYFDLKDKVWLPLPSDSIDMENHVLYSSTTHFTDFITGVIVEPEYPETNAYVPTTMQGLQAADPTTGIDVVIPPVADNTGSAKLSYSLSMPPARNGMAPDVTFTYNSDLASGWLGNGWDMNIPVISVDTRWGVPRYNNTYESETYLYNDIQLVSMDSNGETFLPHRDNQQPRQADRRFWSRLEEDFERIIRKGSTLSGYTWEVTDRYGTITTFGQRLFGTYRGLGTAKIAVAEWYPTRIEELHGDYIEYGYTTAAETGFGGTATRAVYLTEIRAGNSGQEPHTVVKFTMGGQKQKSTDNARYGFMVSNNQLLTRADIYFEGSLLRSYTFEYTDGVFNADLLSKINQHDASGLVIASQEFDYYDDVTTPGGLELYGDSETWNTLNTLNENIPTAFAAEVQEAIDSEGAVSRATALGGSSTKSVSSSFYLGVGVPSIDIITKSNTLGGSYTHSNSNTEGESAMVDINGDGLPDKVYTSGGRLYYNPNTSKPGDAAVTFGPSVPINGINYFSRSKSSSNGGGAKVNLGFLIANTVTGVDAAKTTSTTTAYFADANNDGLIDIISNGKVYFNHIEEDINGNLVPTFTLSSADTPSPYYSGGTISIADTEPTNVDLQENIDYSPTLDVVKVWRAPARGNGILSVQYWLLEPDLGYDQSDYENSDGIVFSIQRNNILLSEETIRKGDYYHYSYNTYISVNENDEFYFRIRSGNTETANGDFDRVHFDAVFQYGQYSTNYEILTPEERAFFELENNISDIFSVEQLGNNLVLDNIYDPVTLEITNLFDENNRIISDPTYPDDYPLNAYIASNSYVPSAEYRLPIEADNTTLQIRSVFTKPVTSSSLVLDILLSNDPVNPDGTVNQNYFERRTRRSFTAAALASNLALNYDIVKNADVTNIRFVIESNINIAWHLLDWKPTVTYIDDKGIERSFECPVRYKVFNTVHQISGPHLHSVSSQVRPGVSVGTSSGGLTVAIKYVQNNKPVTTTQEYTITNGQIEQKWMNIPANVAFWTEVYIHGDELIKKYTKNQIRMISGLNPINYYYPDVYSASTDTGYGPMLRGWGQFVYNSSQGRITQNIDRNLLTLPMDPNTQNLDPLTYPFIPMSYEPSAESFVGPKPSVYVKAEEMGTARMGDNDIFPRNPLDNIATIGSATGEYIKGTEGIGIDLVTKSNSNTVMTGALGVSYSKSTGSSETVTAFTDMNGDGYPDIITNKQIQFTGTTGKFNGEILSGIVNHKSRSSAESWGLGGNPVQAGSSISGDISAIKTVRAQSDGSKSKSNFITATGLAKISSENAQNQVGFFGSLDRPINMDNATETFLDINGDGLPDKVYSDGRIQLNTGYYFLPIISSTGIRGIKEGTTKTLNLGIGLDFGGSSISAGYGIATSDSKTDFDFVDINGDGLTDMIWKEGNDILVAFNNGYGFDTAVKWDGDEIQSNTSTSQSLNAAFTISFNILPIIPVVKISTNIGAAGSTSVSATLNDILDMDGDGYPDLVYSDSDGRLYVRRSKIGRTNKLRTVSNALGGTYTIDYSPSEATYGHPGGKWVMSSVQLDSGIAGDGSPIHTEYEYTAGRYDRHEREFIGFGKVDAMAIDTRSGTPQIMHHIVNEYDVSDYYRQGNLLATYNTDSDGNILTRTDYQYYKYRLRPSGNYFTRYQMDGYFSDRAIGYSPLESKTQTVYEGQSIGYVANVTGFDYDIFGNINSIIYSDKRNFDGDDFSYIAITDYDSNLEKHILGLPFINIVGSEDYEYIRATEAVWDPEYPNHLLQHRSYSRLETLLKGADRDNFIELSKSLKERSNQEAIVAVTDYQWDSFGNISKVTGPENNNGQRLWYEYTYDSKYGMYLTRIDDAFGFSSSISDYDYRFGLPRIQTDINGYRIISTTDDMGRYTSHRGPNEIVENIPYAVKFEYSTDVIKNANGITQPMYSVTSHYDASNPGDDMQTVMMIDGLGRVAQVKKDGVVTTLDSNGTNPTPSDVMIVSGRVVYDPAGRPWKQYYPITEPLGNQGNLNLDFDNVNPTVTLYDGLSRPVSITTTDGRETTLTYSQSLLERTSVATVTDPLGGKTATYTNGSGLVSKTEQLSGPDGIITTYYEYDGLGQLKTATDSYSNKMRWDYDLEGKVTMITHPSFGIKRYEYDNARNLVAYRTSNLIAEDKEITYDYDYYRLTGINYPDRPENNVKYYYGGIESTLGRRGRLTLIEDGSGAQEFEYGLMGEVTRHRRTFIVPNQAIATFETETKYDTWNRLMEMIYPDQEKVSYHYNKGGLVDRMTGTKTYQYEYVPMIGYDKFEQPIYIKYQNGTETVHNYDPLNRRLDNLSVATGAGRKLLNNNYSYDAVDNILSVVNNAPIASGQIGGQMRHNYTYDGIYRLTEASGAFTGNNGGTANYNLEMQYDNIYRITGKKQTGTQTGVTFNGTLSTGYDLGYTYGPSNPYQLTQLTDDFYRTETGGTDTGLLKRENSYRYDANGNLLYVNTLRNTDSGVLANQNERKLIWDEENRLEAVADNGFVSTYWYDGTGERTVKTYGESELVYVNQSFSGGRTGTKDYALYVSPFMVFTSGGNYTKHFYIGSDRMVSKLGDLDSYGADPRRIEYAGYTLPQITVDYPAKYYRSLEIIKEHYDTFDIPYYGIDNDDFLNGGTFAVRPDRASIVSMLNAEKRTDHPSIEIDNPEIYQFYYHPDHLGSTSIITNLDGDMVQHVEYTPFGEVFIEERNSQWNTPYLFNGKELDEQTGLYYYGARYYNPRESMWLGVDPLADKYPGVTPYAYTLNNPVRYVDLFGLDWYEKNNTSSKNEDSDSKYIFIDGTLNNRQLKNNGLSANIGKVAVREGEYLSLEGNRINLNNESELISTLEYDFQMLSYSDAYTYNSSVEPIINILEWNENRNTIDLKAFIYIVPSESNKYLRSDDKELYNQFRNIVLEQGRSFKYHPINTSFSGTSYSLIEWLTVPSLRPVPQRETKIKFDRKNQDFRLNYYKQVGLIR